MNNLLKHPILIHQKKEANIVQKHSKNLIDKIKKVRNDLEDFLIIDIIIKLFRENICSLLNCEECNKCSPTNLMTEEKFLLFLSNNTNEIIEKIRNWYNNSFNSPYRWFFIQNIIDKLIPNNDNIIYIEIWCWAGLIWKILTNSNYSKKEFPELFENTLKTNREKLYLWIDPNLIKGSKNKIMLINWDTPEMKYTRYLVKCIEENINFKENHMIYLKWFFNEENFDIIIKNILNRIKNSQKRHLIFITSMIKYYFHSYEDIKKFNNNIIKFTNKIKKNYQFKSIKYIENEVRWKNNLLYPSQTSDYYKTQMLVYNVLENCISFSTDFKEYEYYF